MMNVKLNVEGMHCEGCSTRLEKVLSNIEGVKEASVSLKEKIATIDYDETKTSQEELKEAIIDAGFEVV